MLKKIRTYGWLLGAVFLLPGARAENAGSGTEKPNIVLIVSDDHGLQLGCYGDKGIKTPHMDALAADGVRFVNAFCTASSCSASRATILTGLHNHANGQYGHSHGVHHFRTLEGLKSLPIFLKEGGGYRTARVGKMHVWPEEPYAFDQVIPANKRNPVEMANKSRKFIEEGEEPFFLYFCPFDPHPDQKSSDLPYSPNLFGNREGGYRGVKQIKYGMDDVDLPSFVNKIPRMRAQLAQYYQSVSRLDQGIGRLVSILRETGKYDNTVVVYISDNGPPLPGAKINLYDQGLRLPCIVRTPEMQRRGSVCDAMVSWVDIAPTLCDFGGALPDDRQLEGLYKKFGRHFHGRSFKTAMQQASPEGWDEIHASQTFHTVWFYYPMRVVQDRDYKLIWNLAYQLPFPDPPRESALKNGFERDGKLYHNRYRTVDAFLQRPEFELYHMAKDPNETINLADDPEHAVLLAQYKQKMKSFQEDTRDPWVRVWER